MALHGTLPSTPRYAGMSNADPSIRRTLTSYPSSRRRAYQHAHPRYRPGAV